MNRTVSVLIGGVVRLDKMPVDTTCQTADRITEALIGLFCIRNDIGGNVDIAFDDVLLTAR